LADEPPDLRERPAWRLLPGRLAGIAVLVLLPLLLVATARAEEEGWMRPVDERWAERLSEAAARIDETRDRLQAAEAALEEAEHEDHPRGEALQAIQDERAAAQAAYERARARLPELVARARDAGVYREVLRPYWRRLEARDDEEEDF